MSKVQHISYRPFRHEQQRTQSIIIDHEPSNHGQPQHKTHEPVQRVEPQHTTPWVSQSSGYNT